MSKKSALTHNDVVFDGDKLVIPTALAGKYQAARDLISQFEQANETPIEVYADVPCFPLDGIVALSQVMLEQFSFVTTGRDALSVNVTTADGSRVPGLLGKISPPAWEGGHICATVNGSMAMTLRGCVKKKHESQFRAIVKSVEHHLSTKSIYKGQAFRLDLSWIDADEGYNCVRDQPKFMEGLADCPSLILSDTTEHLLGTSLFLPIMARDACRANGIPIKRGILLAGPYGCGKSLTAQTTANLCVGQGWTFIYLTTPSRFVEAYRTAMHFAPCVLFVEDADQILSGERNEQLNGIFNALSGVDTKNAEVITVFTTNHAERIHPGILRAERIDRVIHFAHPDAKSAARFVAQYAKTASGETLLAPTVKLSVVGEHLAGFSPAFIRATVESAKANALYQNRDLLDTDDLVVAADAYTEQRRLVERAQEPTKAQRLVSATRLLGEAMEGSLSE